MKILIILVALAAMAIGCSQKTPDQTTSPSATESSDKLEPVDINCTNNLKVIWLALKAWSNDHQNHFPWNVSTNQGGTLELCALDAEGFDSNAALHFQAVSNELRTPRLLICPEDSSRKAAMNFHDLQPTNITYRLRTAPYRSSENHTNILMLCPVDGNALLEDGTVIKSTPTPNR